MRPLLLRLVMSGGLLLLALSLSLRAATTPAYAQPPRPTIQPTATPTAPPAPTSTPKPKGDSDDDEPALPGRITGTVIDLTTGAPAPGIAVLIGDIRVVSDASGNYDRNGLSAGSYTVALALANGQGTPAQGPIVVALGAGATVVQHLSFSSPLPATAMPAAPTATPAAVPPGLPRTGDGSGGGSAALLWAALALAGGALLLRRSRLLR
jgi:hypothetical protein